MSILEVNHVSIRYMTGDFNAEAIVLPDGVTLDALKPACRKLSIFLK